MTDTTSLLFGIFFLGYLAHNHITHSIAYKFSCQMVGEGISDFAMSHYLHKALFQAIEAGNVDQAKKINEELLKMH
jgi:DNA-binding FadR family transcriptional regulator